MPIDLDPALPRLHPMPLPSMLDGMRVVSDDAVDLVPVRLEQVGDAPTMASALGKEDLVGLPHMGWSLLASLADEAKLRFFVDGGNNAGHQAATVNLAIMLLQHIRATGRSPNEKLEVEFACVDASGMQKVGKFLGSGSLGKVKYKAVLLDKIKGKDRVKYAFAGAADQPEKILEKLRADNVIVLQPHGWVGGKEAVFHKAAKGFDQLVLTNKALQPSKEVGDMLGLPGEFRRLPFGDFSQYAVSDKARPDGAADQIVHRLLDDAKQTESTQAPVYVCPIYGMGGSQPLETYGKSVWINVITALQLLTRKNEFKAKVIVLNVSPDLGNKPDQVWGGLTQHFSANNEVAIFRALENPGAVQRVFDALTQGASVAVCSVTGSKDIRTMDRVYRTSALPPIFEGQGSLTQVLAMGRPFIKYSIRADPDGVWPSDYLPIDEKELAGVDVAVQQRANKIVEKLVANDLPADGGVDLANLFYEIHDQTSRVAKYFAACREVVGNPAYDRLAWAAEALHRLEVFGATGKSTKAHAPPKSFIQPIAIKSGHKYEKGDDEASYTNELEQTFTFVDNPGGGNCLYYAALDGLAGRAPAAATAYWNDLNHRKEADTLRKEAVRHTALLISRGQGLSAEMFAGMEHGNDIDVLLERAMPLVQTLQDRMFQVAKAKERLAPDYRFGDNDDNLIKVLKERAKLVEAALDIDVPLAGMLERLSNAYRGGQGRDGVWAGELEYVGIALQKGVNVTVHYRSPVPLPNNQRVLQSRYEYKAVAAERLGLDVAAANRSIDILHVGNGTHYVYGKRR